MRQLNYRELTGSLNKFRMEHQSKTYTREELISELQKLGFAPAMAQKVMVKFIPSEHVGKKKLYSFGSEPIHNSQIEALYQSVNNKKYKAIKDKIMANINVSSEEKAIATLQAAGYQVRKVVGFDMERFQKENPVLYKRYLKYEIV